MWYVYSMNAVVKYVQNVTQKKSLKMTSFSLHTVAQSSRSVHLLIYISSPLEIRPRRSQERSLGTPCLDVFFDEPMVPTPTKFCSLMGSDPRTFRWPLLLSNEIWDILFPTNLGWHELHVQGWSLVGTPSVLHRIMFHLTVRLPRQACFGILRPRF